jgi:hypothetical protein
MAGFFDKLFGGGGTAEGAEKGIAERDAKLRGGEKIYRDETGKAAGYYDEAQKWFDPSYETANKGNADYADAAGLNGPEGTARANAKFRATPGFQGSLDEAANQEARLGALLGRGGSTNTSIGVNTALTNQLNKFWGDYTGRLAPYMQQAPQIAGQRAGISTGKGNLFSGMGRDLFTGYTNVGNQNAGSYLEAGKAEDQGARNLLDTVLGVGKLAGNILAPGSGSLMDLGSSLAGGLTGGQGYGTGGRRSYG